MFAKGYQKIFERKKTEKNIYLCHYLKVGIQSDSLLRKKIWFFFYFFLKYYAACFDMKNTDILSDEK